MTHLRASFVVPMCVLAVVAERHCSLLGALFLMLDLLPVLPFLYCGLYACYNLFHPIRLATISDLVRFLHLRNAMSAMPCASVREHG